MPRPVIVLVLLVLIIAGAALFLSSRATEVPIRTIEADVADPNNAQ